MINGGGGGVALLRKLYSLKKAHRKKQKIYTETTQVFPSLKYPALKNCPDYNLSLKYKFHLSYLLGQALIRADKEKFSGGYLRLFSYIKEAKEIFRHLSFLKEFDINLDTLFGNLASLSVEQRQIFLATIKDIFERHKDYKELLDNILRNFKYFLDNFKEIETWLKSDDFYENFKNKKHPYPSLLDPKKINYDDMSAELAFSLYLPLQPDRCNVLWYLRASSASVATRSFLHNMGVVLNSFELRNLQSLKDNYTIVYNNKDAVICATHRPIIFSLWQFLPKIPFRVFYIHRDPIPYLKHHFNHIRTFGSSKKVINLRTNFKQENVFPKPNSHAFLASKDERLNTKYVKHIANYLLASNRYIDIIKDKIEEFYIIDFEDVKTDKAFDTFTKLAKHFGFNSPSDKALFSHRINRHNGDLNALPVKFIAHESDLDYIYDENNTDHKENEESFKLDDRFEVLITTYSITTNRDNFVDITKEFFDEDKLIFKQMLFLIDKNKYEDFKKNEKLFLASKKYLNAYLDAMHEHEKKIEEKLITEEEFLECLKDKKELRIELKKLMDKDMFYVKKYHPEYIQKWKYYQEFLKLCEKDELETKDEN